jgi:hypothetical protein
MLHRGTRPTVMWGAKQMPEQNGTGRRKDTMTRDRIDEIARNYERFARITIIIWIVLTAVVAGLGVLDTWLTIQNSNRVAESAKLGEKIQDQRRLQFLDDCKTTNSRHDNAINVLNGLANGLKAKNPKASKLIDTQVKQNITLIDAIVPKQNCKKVLQHTVGIP